MNERIKELAEQATESKGFLTAGDSVPPLPVKEFNKEKFAQLIVKECAEFAEYQLQIGGTNADKIKQHFGVLE